MVVLLGPELGDRVTSAPGPGIHPMSPGTPACRTWTDTVTTAALAAGVPLAAESL
jgi:hypothetical protein